MSTRVVYLAGEWVSEKDAKISIYDLSCMQGAAAFEMTRSFNGMTFKLREHLERLENSCKLLDIPLPRDWHKVAEVCQEAQWRNPHEPDDEHRLLIVVSPGAAPIYHQIDGVQKESWLYIADFPLRYTTAGLGQYYETGVEAVTSKVMHVSSRSIPAEAKHRSRLHFHLAQQQAAGKWAILTDGGMSWLESPGANLCSVYDDTLWFHTRNALPGITMATVRGMAAHKKWRIRDADGWEPPADKMDELWLMGTPFCLLSVKSVDGKPVGIGKPGPRYIEMIHDWSVMTGVDIPRQIQTWDLPAKTSTTITPQELHAL